MKQGDDAGIAHPDYNVTTCGPVYTPSGTVVSLNYIGSDIWLAVLAMLTLPVALTSLMTTRPEPVAQNLLLVVLACASLIGAFAHSVRRRTDRLASADREVQALGYFNARHYLQVRSAALVERVATDPDFDPWADPAEQPW